MGAKVNGCCRLVKATAAAADQVNLTALRVSKVRGVSERGVVVNEFGLEISKPEERLDLLD